MPGHVCVLSLSCFSRVQLFVMLWTVPARLLCPWDSPGKNVGFGCHAHLQRIFPTQELNLDLPHCRQILYCIFCTKVSCIADRVSTAELPGKPPNARAWSPLTEHSCQRAGSEKRLLFQDAFPRYCPFFNPMKYHHTRLNSYIDVYRRMWRKLHIKQEKIKLFDFFKVIILRVPYDPL